MKIKIVQPGWEGYTGPLGLTEFVDAVSVDHVNEMERKRLGTILQIVEVEVSGEDGEQVSLGVDYADAYNIPAPIEARLPTQAELNKAKAEAESSLGEILPTPAETSPEVPVEPLKVFTREELEAIADEKGIKGLREVSDRLGVKSNSIPVLIDAIIQAQSPNPEIPGVSP